MKWRKETAESVSQQALALQQLATLVGNGTPRATPERNSVKTNNASVKSKNFAIPLGVGAEEADDFDYV